MCPFWQGFGVTAYLCSTQHPPKTLSASKATTGLASWCWPLAGFLAKAAGKGIISFPGGSPVIFLTAWQVAFRNEGSKRHG